ncbi:MAG: hypothetical protein AUI14_20650 [Actinobacteria bacterium 13_2_20CM_2_71_6]|nr:MAG: hypothetical protein AUI14_20650 [Actinobacteria bacterium 13_2_20CM_2_71_6]
MEDVHISCRSLALLVVAIATVGVGGCTVTASVHTSDPLTPAPSAASALPATLTRQQAAQLYEQLAAPGNAARDRWMSAGPTTDANLAAHEHLADQAADAYQTFAAQLRAHRWPPDADAYIQRLATDLDLRVQAYRRVARPQTVAEYAAAANRVPLSSAAASAVRQVLGLPPGPTFCACPTPP